MSIKEIVSEEEFLDRVKKIQQQEEAKLSSQTKES